MMFWQPLAFGVRGGFRTWILALDEESFLECDGRRMEIE